MTVRRLGLGLVLLGSLTLPGCNLIGRASVPIGGSSVAPPPSTAPSSSPAISADGALTAFVSTAADLVAGDTNGRADVFVRSSATKATTRVSVTNAGAQSGASSSDPAISGNGRYVAFVSSSSGLVAGDTNGVADVFIRDRTAGTTSRVSVTSAGGQAAGASSDPAISANGRYVAFVSVASNVVVGDTNSVADVFVRDRTTGSTTRLSVGATGAQVAGASTTPSISPSGDWVAFTSAATNLVTGDTNGADDVFLARRSGGSVRRASAPDTITKPLQQANGPSSRPQVTDGVGSYAGGGEPVVAYQSRATNLAGTEANGSGFDVFITTFQFGVARTGRMSTGTIGGRFAGVGVSGGGPRVVVTYVGSSGSSSGEIVSVERDTPVSTGLVRPRIVSQTNEGDPANGPSDEPALSSDGRFVAFRSQAGNLAGGQSASTVGDVFVGRAREVVATSVEPGRVGVQQTRNLTVRGRGFEPGSLVAFDGGVRVNSVTFVSSEELTANVTADTAPPNAGLLDVHVLTGGAAGSGDGYSGATCAGCVEIASVVDQPGPVDIEVVGGVVSLGGLNLALPGCTLDTCLALPGTVSPDGELAFGLESIALDPIPIELELFAGVPVTIELVPAFVAPQGSVIPASGAVDLGFGLAVKLRNPLLPSACALGPVQADLSAGPGGDPLGTAYDRLSGTASLAGGFTEELAITGCGLFTGTLNGLLGLPLPIGDSAVRLDLRFDPVLTGTVVP